jgi:hypothetical protein
LLQVAVVVVVVELPQAVAVRVDLERLHHFRLLLVLRLL